MNLKNKSSFYVLHLLKNWHYSQTKHEISDLFLSNKLNVSRATISRMKLGKSLQGKTVTKIFDYCSTNNISLGSINVLDLL